MNIAQRRRGAETSPRGDEPFSRGERLLLWFCTLAVVVSVGAVISSAQVTVNADSPESQRQAYVAPWTALTIVAGQCRESDVFSRFNLPLRSVLVTCLWLVGLVGVGRLAAHRLMAVNASRLERLVFSFAVGFTAVGLFTLFVGAAGLARPWAMWGILAIGAATGCAQLVRAGSRDVRKLFDSGSGGTNSAGECDTAATAPRVERIILLVVHSLVVLLLVAGFLYALTPPIQSDAVRYHLAAPQEYLKAGRIGYLPHNAFSNFPFLMEMHFMLALGAGAPEASQLMHYLTFLACAAAIAAFCRRFVAPLDPSPRQASRNGASFAGRLGRTVAVCAYIGMPAGLVVASWPFVDHAVCLFLFLALYGLLLAFESGTRGAYVLAGIMLGSAIGTKYTAVPFALVIGAILLVEWFAFSPPPAARVRRTILPGKVAAWVLASVIVCAPWFIKNVVLTGNPVYPLASKIFPGGDWTPVSGDLYAAKMKEKGTAKTFANFMASPLMATYEWMDYESHYPGATLVVLPIAALAGLAAVLARARNRGRPLFYLAAAAAAYYVLWFMTYQSNRMLVPFVVFLAPLACALVQLCAGCSGAMPRILGTALMMGWIYGMAWAVQWEYALSSPAPAPYLLGGTMREAYVSKALNYWQAFDYVNRQTATEPRGTKVLLVGEHRIYGARFSAQWSDWYDTPAVLALMRKHGIRNSAELVSLLKAQDIGWVIYNQPELSQYEQTYYRPRFSDREWAILQDFLASNEFERKTIPPGIVVLRLK